MSVEESGKRYVRVAFESGWFAVGLGYGLGKVALHAANNKLFPDLDPEHLKQTSSLHAARIGIKAVRDGRKKDVPEQQFFGEAMAIRAAVQADRDDVTHPEVVQEIVGMVADAGIDPELSPLVADHEAAQAQELLRQHNEAKSIS